MAKTTVSEAAGIERESAYEQRRATKQLTAIDPAGVRELSVPVCRRMSLAVAA